MGGTYGLLFPWGVWLFPLGVRPQGGPCSVRQLPLSPLVPPLPSSPLTPYSFYALTLFLLFRAAHTVGFPQVGGVFI